MRESVCVSVWERESEVGEGAEERPPIAQEPARLELRV